MMCTSIADLTIIIATHRLGGTDEEFEAVRLILTGLINAYSADEVPWTLRKVHGVSDQVLSLLPEVELTTIKTFRALAKRAGL